MNMTMRLNTSAELPLQPSIAPSGINVTGYFGSTFYVDLPNGSQAEVFMLNTTAHLTATVSLNSTAKTAPTMSLHYNLDLAKVDLSLVQSTIGSFNPVGLQIFFNYVRILFFAPVFFLPVCFDLIAVTFFLLFFLIFNLLTCVCVCGVTIRGVLQGCGAKHCAAVEPSGCKRVSNTNVGRHCVDEPRDCV